MLIFVPLSSPNENLSGQRVYIFEINFFTMTTHVIEEELQEKFACCSWELSLILLQVQDSLFADIVTTIKKSSALFLSCRFPGFKSSLSAALVFTTVEYCL